MAWVKELFVSLKLPENTMIETLELTSAVLKEILTPEMAVVTDEYIEAGLAQFRQTPVMTPSYISTAAPLSDLAQQYVDALLRSDRQSASRLIIDAVKEGADIKDVYLHVFLIL